MRTVKDLNLKNKRVLVRCDFNVPLNEKGEIQDDFRIQQSLKTINYLIERGAKIVLMTHLGDPQGRMEEKLSVKRIQEKLAEYLKHPVLWASDCIGKDVEKIISKLKEGEVLVLENLRFHPEEKMNDSRFAKELAKLGDIYINDAFGVCHREHASIVGLPKYLPSGAGFLLEKEIKVLSRVLENPWRPLVAIIGGAKIESKTKLIKNLLKKADHLLIGGKIANIILLVKKIYVGDPWPEEKIVKEIENIELTSTKMHLPVDAVVSLGKEATVTRVVAPANKKKDEFIFDIGPETINIFSKIIKEAKMIVWAGPLGFFENPLFEKGTKEIGEVIVRNHKAYKIAGGGDTIFSLKKFGIRDKFDHVSTGGGAMLSFLSGKKLPGIEALEK